MLSCNQYSQIISFPSLLLVSPGKCESYHIGKRKVNFAGYLTTFLSCMYKDTANLPKCSYYRQDDYL
ncbi:hypothetical protein EVA_03064 [gut metagenome]|uniref:Uncharacterized protein n=1 Tax=gut metagenome TaxID=749906 RepID=J9D7Q5_9ZZZZ